MKIPSLTLLLDAFTAVVRRFPMAMISAVTGVAVLMAILEDHDNATTFNLWMVAHLGLPLFVGLVVFGEDRGWSRRDWQYWALAAGGLALLAVYFLALPDPRDRGFEDVDLPRYMALLGVAHLFVAAAPYLNGRRVDDFWEYNKQLFANLVIGAAYTLILWGGLALAILAVDQLFDFHIQGKAYGHLFILLAGLFNTAFFLYHFPKNYAFDETDTAYNAVFKNLCKYILIPIVILYFLILYAYAAKILLSWTLPKGWVGVLVLGFSVAGIFTYLLNYLLPRYDPGLLISRYRRWFWWVLLPMVLLLFIAISRRIGDYGVTEPRYFVAVAGLWLLACGLYFALSRTDNIKFIPISLAIFALVSVFGPWSAFAVSRRSQLAVLEDLLVKNGRLANGRIAKAETELPDPDATRIYSLLYYLHGRGALAGSVEPWLGMPLDSLPSTRRKDEVGRFSEWIGLRRGTPAEQVSITVSQNRQINSGNMRGYQTWYRESLRIGEEEPSSGRYFAITADGSSLVWREKRGDRVEDLDRFDLRPNLKAWLAQADEGNSVSLEAGDETIDFNGRRAELRLVVEEIQLIETATGQPGMRYFQGLIFLKDKVK